MDKSRYPANWREISDDIRFNRAGSKCEQCGAPHKEHIWRKLDNPYEWTQFGDEEFTYYHGHEYADNPVLVILTVHHIGVDKPDGTPGDPSDKLDVRPENLIALCQRCHLQADLIHHLENRKATLAKKRAEKIAATGQLDLFGGAS